MYKYTYSKMIHGPMNSNKENIRWFEEILLLDYLSHF